MAMAPNANVTTLKKRKRGHTPESPLKFECHRDESQLTAKQERLFAGNL